MSNESPEYESLLHCTSDLIECLQHSLSVADKLLEKGLVTADVHNVIKTAQGLSERDKARRLVTCVTSRIKLSTEKFNILIEALRKESYFDDIVEKIKAEHRKWAPTCDTASSTSKRSSVLQLNPTENSREKQEGMLTPWPLTGMNEIIHNRQQLLKILQQ